MRHLHTLWHALSVRGELGERHRPSGCSDAFQTTAQDIDSYLDAARRKVIAGRTDLETPQRDWIIEGNSPFHRLPQGQPGTRRGILMVHGLTDAPYLVRDLGDFFQRIGFRVLAMQLPGHGTRPGDLLEVRWQDWLAAQRRLIELLGAQVDELYLAGFSTGATLNLYETLLRDDIRGVLLFSPAIRVRRIAAVACALRRFGRRRDRFAWIDVQPDSDCFKYESLSSAAVCEVYRLIEAYHRLETVQPLRVPLFVAASENDVTVDSHAALAWFGGQKSAVRKMLYYSTGAPQVPDGVDCIPAAVPEQRIESFAHTALLQSPDNPHYGRDGRLRFCTHYYHFDRDKYRRCKAGDEDCRGEIFHHSHRCRVLRRLTWNPYFDDMLAAIDAFLAQAGRADTQTGGARPDG